MTYSSQRPSLRAFSLVELLVVLGIIAIVAAISIPAISSVMRSYQLDTTGQMVVHQLTLARQTALSGSHAVEVWFYELPDYNGSATAVPTVYRGMQAFTEGEPAATGSPPLTAVTKPIFFPAPVLITTTTTPQNLSPLLPASPTTPASTDPSLPNYGQNYKYVVFRFRPDGSADVSSAANSFTLMLEADKVNATTGLPNNYVTLRIDPVVGSVQTYRP